MYYFFKSFSSIIILLIISLFLCSCQSTVKSLRRFLWGIVQRIALFPDAYASGGNKWTRTTDLTLIRRVL